MKYFIFVSLIIAVAFAVGVMVANKLLADYGINILNYF